MKYKQWMVEVDQLLSETHGLSHRDLPDQPWRAWFDDEVTPEEAAEMCLERS